MKLTELLDICKTMSLKLPTIKVLLELFSFLFQMLIGFLILSLFLPFIVVRIIVVEIWDSFKMYFKILSQSNFIKRLKIKK